MEYDYLRLQDDGPAAVKVDDNNFGLVVIKFNYYTRVAIKWNTVALSSIYRAVTFWLIHIVATITAYYHVIL